MLRSVSNGLILHIKDTMRGRRIFICRYSSGKQDENNNLEQINRSKFLFSPKWINLPFLNSWNEAAAVRKNKRDNQSIKKIDNMVDFLNFLQGLRNIPTNPKELRYYLKKKRIWNEIYAQQFLPRRHIILKPDLAAAHFLLARGGAVKFVGKDWMGRKGSKAVLPNTFIPGYLIEAIDAEGTNLLPEGLSNMCALEHLTSLSLKGCEEMNDWALDWISMEYHTHLEHIDLTDCKYITYRGLSCFYRFEKLKTLNLKGIPETTELKLACLMLQDIMPSLEISGIDLTVPEKIEPINLEKIKNIPDK